MKTLSGTTKFRRSAPAASCSEVVTIATKLTELAIEFPLSSDIPGLSLQITTSSVTCTDAEKTDLKGLDSKFQEALTEIAEALKEAKKELGLTEVKIKKQCNDDNDYIYFLVTYNHNNCNKDNNGGTNRHHI